jgi:hypothetical protein
LILVTPNHAMEGFDKRMIVEGQIPTTNSGPQVGQ